MNPLLLILSTASGLIPFNHINQHSLGILDYLLMLVVPVLYFTCYILANFSTFGVYQLPSCDDICQLGNVLFMHLGCFLYVTVFLLTANRRKTFFVNFYAKLQDIDDSILRCQLVANDKMKLPPNKQVYYICWIIVLSIFCFAVYYDVSKMLQYYEKYFYIAVMLNTFPYVAGSIVQGQFIYYVSVISGRFKEINTLFKKINRECERKNGPIEVFDIETNSKKSEKMGKGHIITAESPKEKETANEDVSSSSSDDEEDDDEVYAEAHVSDGTTSESNLPELFKLHDKILSLSILTNAEFGPQCVPYMAACFVISIFAIFLETKVIFIVGGKHHLLDYVATLYVIWTGTTITVAYFVLRLCCNANGQSKQSAMIVHEIMQKKPAFMLGNDLYYNKMKSFTLQFLHWEGFFQFNGIGLFALDYTFIFSSVSAATSYLIVLLQFDMTSILKTQGLI